MGEESATEQSVMEVIRGCGPSFRHAHDMVAFAVHATFAASGFVLRATGSAAFGDIVFVLDCNRAARIDHWNQVDANYAFAYSHPKCKKVVVKCLALNGKLHVDALRRGNPDVIAQLDINVGNYLQKGIHGGNYDVFRHNYGLLYKNLGELVRDVDNQLVRKFRLHRPTPPPVCYDELRVNTAKEMKRTPPPFVSPVRQSPEFQIQSQFGYRPPTPNTGHSRKEDDDKNKVQPDDNIRRAIGPPLIDLSRAYPNPNNYHLTFAPYSPYQ